MTKVQPLNIDTLPFHTEIALPRYTLSRPAARGICGTAETLHFDDGFVFVRDTFVLSRPLFHPAFEAQDFDYIGLCFCFAAAPASLAAHPHLFTGNMNATNGYAHADGFDRALHTPMHYIALRLSRRYVQTLSEQLALPDWLMHLTRENGVFRHIPVPPVLRAHMRKICALPPAKSPTARLYLESAVLEWLARLLEMKLLPEKRSRIDDVIDILDHGYSEKHSIAALARTCGINTCTLKYAFKERTGQTINAYLNARRLDEACRLLRECPHMDIADIAAHTGHQTRYFYRWFAKHTGMTPGQYRERA